MTWQTNGLNKCIYGNLIFRWRTRHARCWESEGEGMSAQKYLWPTWQNVPHYTFDGYFMVGDPGCTETLSAQTNRINFLNSLSKFVILMLLIVFAILNKQWQWYQGLTLNYGSVCSILFHFYSPKEILAIWEYLYKIYEKRWLRYNFTDTALRLQWEFCRAATWVICSFISSGLTGCCGKCQLPRTSKNQLVFAAGPCCCSHCYTASLNLSCRVFSFFFSFTCPDECSSFFSDSLLFVT